MTFVFTQPTVPMRQIQLRRRIVLAVLMLSTAPLLPLVCAVWLHSYPLIHAQIEQAGTFLIFTAIFGRTWCALHIGGLKKATIVDTGPYSIVRNPLYVFTLIGAAGIGAQTSSLVVTALCALLTGAVFAVVVRKEEAFLTGKFGLTYLDYMARVPRFVPRFSGYRDVGQLAIHMRVVQRTFIESCYFLIAIPGFDILERARDYGWIPDLIHLP